MLNQSMVFKEFPYSDINNQTRFTGVAAPRPTFDKTEAEISSADPNEMASNQTSDESDNCFRTPFVLGKQQTQNYKKSIASDMSVYKEPGNKPFSMFQQNFSTEKDSHACMPDIPIPCETNVKSEDMVYTCGGCNKTFSSVCKLHSHLLDHGSGGSYRYIHILKTAFPTYDTVCASTQTASEEEIASVDEEDMKESCVSNVELSQYNTGDEENNSVAAVCIKVEKDILPESINYVAYQGDKYDYDLFTEMKNNDFTESDQVSVPDKKTRQLSSGKSISKKIKAEVTKEGIVDECIFVPKRDKHKPETRKKGTKNHKCSICNKAYASKVSLRLHQSKCHPDIEIEPSKTYKCKWCCDSFKKRRQIGEHLKICDKNASLRCFICDTFQTSREKYNEHLTTHRNEQDLTCIACDRQFSNVFIMQTHIKRHKLPRNIQCEQCGKAFYHRTMLSKHLVHCTEEKSLQCPQCELMFKTKDALKHHASVHTEERPYICHICGHAAKKKMYLTRHIRSHTGERPYPCKICGMRFSALNGLNRHNKAHNNVKTCICSYCGKGFANNWNLRTHERQHTGDTPYKCDHCGMGFKQNVLVKLHLKSHHPDIAQVASQPDSMT